LPDGSLLPSTATVLRMNTPRPSVKTIKHVIVSTTPVAVYKALFSNSSCAFHKQEWFNRARVRPYLALLVGLCRILWGRWLTKSRVWPGVRPAIPVNFKYKCVEMFITFHRTDFGVD
jgi:hypothetical protein